MKSSSSAIIVCLALSGVSAFQQYHGSPRQRMSTVNKQISSSSTIHKHQGRISSSPLYMKPSSRSENDSATAERRRTSLSASTLLSVASLDDKDGMVSSLLPRLNLPKGDNIEAIAKVLSASLLVTGNTVGSSMLVLPEAVGGVGMVWGSTIFLGASALLFVACKSTHNLSLTLPLSIYRRNVHLPSNVWSHASRRGHQTTRII
jgi:hypothetical protein